MLERSLPRRSALGTRENDPPLSLVEREGLRIVEERFLCVVSVRASRKGGEIAALLSGLGLEAPQQPLDVTGDAQSCCAWIEPRAWLVIGSDAANLPSVTGIQAIDVSPRYAAFRISGPDAEDLLAGALGKVPSEIGPRRCARTRFAEECEVFIHRLTEQPEFWLLIDAPLAGFAAAWLRDAAGRR